jgi:hypothetical protein
MLLSLFESRERNHADQQELGRLRTRYGDDLLTELERRAARPNLRDRDRQHWKRILRKARGSAIIFRL